MKEIIEKQVIKEIKYALDDLDIEGMIKKLTSSKAVNEAVEEHIKSKISDLIQQKAYNMIQQQMPIIDMWTETKVQEFLYELKIK